MKYKQTHGFAGRDSTKHRLLVYVINVDWYFELHWLARALASQQAGFDVHLIMAETDADITRRMQALGVVCHSWAIDRKSLNPFFNLKGIIQLYRYLRTLSPDIIHAITIKPNIYTGLLNFVLKTPYLLSVTGTGTVFSGKSLTVRLVRPIIRGFYKLIKQNNAPRRMVFENNEDRDYFVNTGLCSAQEAQVILGAGVNTQVYFPVAEPETDCPIILFAARLLWDKGLGDLIEAAKLLRQQGLNFVIQVAGIVDKSTMNAIDEAILLNWNQEGWITWLGTVKAMPQLIQQSNMVVLPSFYGEGVPRILIEAAACGRAIVTTDMPGCREIVQDNINGLLVPARNVPALATALAVLLKDAALRKRMGAQGRKMVVQDYSEDDVIEQTLALYQELLS